MKRSLWIVAVLAFSLSACDKQSTLLTEAPYSSDDELLGVTSKFDLPDGVVYNEYNRNYYAAVAAPKITWFDAYAAANGESVGQCRSHLAAVTSRQEDAWIAETFPEAIQNGYWLGATQEEGAPNPAAGWN
ncbi:MAG: hypothetical protein HKN13_12145 [Rhodothermales bacterium]|nr:hypothetical protein [Rhodothermales bacterium]